MRTFRYASALLAPLALVAAWSGACASDGGTPAGAGGGQGCTTDAECLSPGAFCAAGVCQVDPDFSAGVDDDAATAMGQTAPTDVGAPPEPTTVGAVIDSFCGIQAYQNGPSVTATWGSSPYGYKFQCTELGYRFLCQHYQLCDQKTGSYGNAKQWYDNPKQDPVLAQLVRYPSGGTEPPVPGDLVIWNYGTYGHVAVVKSVLGNDVQVIEQNDFHGTHHYGLSASNGHYTINSARGWMRVPGAAPACGDGTGGSSSSSSSTAASSSSTAASSSSSSTAASSSSTAASSSSSSGGGVCGDGVCGAGENQSNCCRDCGCPASEVCSNGACVPTCPPGNYGRFSILEDIYNPGNPDPSFGPAGCSGDGTTMLKLAAEMTSPTNLHFHVRKEDDSVFGSAATLTLYVGSGPTCPTPPNMPKASVPLTVGAVDETIDLSVSPYPGGWALGETKQFWVGKSEGGYPSWRASGVISVTQTCIP